MKIAVLGSGLVARRLLDLLVERRKDDEIVCYSDHIDLLKARGRDLRTRRYRELKGERYDVAFGCLDAKSTAEIYKDLHANLFVDNSELFRLTGEVPLIAGKMNAHLLTASTPIASNPNCVVAMAAYLLLPLSHRYGISKCILTSLQSTSGLGSSALSRLDQERSDYEYLDGEVVPRFTLGGEPVPLFDNLIPQVGEIESNLSTHEENKIAEELKKLISPNFEIACNCYRVPIRTGHTLSLHLTLKEPVDIMKITRFIELETLLIHQDSATLKSALDDPFNTYITRIKPDPFCPYALMVTLFSDNLSVGAAYNSYLIYESYLRLKNVL